MNNNVAPRSQVGWDQSPSLRVVEGTAPTQRRSAVLFLLTCALLLAIAIVVPLVANTNMAQISYDMRDASIQLTEETAKINTLEGQLLEASSPQALREKAMQIGLVPAAPIGVVVLSEGTVEGGVAAQ